MNKAFSEFASVIRGDLVFQARILILSIYQGNGGTKATNYLNGLKCVPSCGEKLSTHRFGRTGLFELNESKAPETKC